MRMSDWSSDECSSDLALELRVALRLEPDDRHHPDPDRGREGAGGAPAGDGTGKDRAAGRLPAVRRRRRRQRADLRGAHERDFPDGPVAPGPVGAPRRGLELPKPGRARHAGAEAVLLPARPLGRRVLVGPGVRSEEHTSELQSLMRISYAVFCLKKKKYN